MSIELTFPSTMKKSLDTIQGYGYYARVPSVKQFESR